MDNKLAYVRPAARKDRTTLYVCNVGILQNDNNGSGQNSCNAVYLGRQADQAKGY